MAETQLVLSTVVKWTESATRDLNNVRDSLGWISKETKTLWSTLSSIGGGIIKFWAIASTALVGLGGLGLSMAGDFEQTSIAFKTMLGDGKKASLMLEDLSKFAAETPFEFPEIANAGKSLLAFGFEADKIKWTLTRLGDVASALNIPLGEISEIYGKARVQGRLFAEDINQLTGRGIPVISELAKVLGTTEGNVKNMVEKGKVGFPELQKAFENMTNEGGKFAWGMKAQSTSLNGLLSTAKDNLTALLREIIGINLSGEVAAGSILEKAKTLVTSFAQFTSENKESIKGFLNGVIEGFTIFFQVLGEVISKGLAIAKAFWAEYGESIKGNTMEVIAFLTEFWTKYGDDILVILNKIADIFVVTFNIIKGIVQTVMFIIGPLVHDTIMTIAWVIQFLSGLISGDFTKVWQGLKTTVFGIMQVLGDIVLAFVDLVARAFGTDIVTIIDKTMNYLSKKAQEAKQFVSDIFWSVNKASSSFANNFSIQGVVGALSWARASGGPVSGGKSYLVGERGPEIFTPGTSGQIIPNNKIGGSAGSVIINISGVFGQNAADEIGQMIVNRLKGASYI